MSYPPPPGLKPNSISSTPKTHSSLPPRPPPSANSQSSFKSTLPPGPLPAHSAPGVGSYGGPRSSTPSSGLNSFTAFAPRSVASSNYRSNTAAIPTYSASPQPHYGSAPQPAGPQSSYPGASAAPGSYNTGAAPAIQNPFVQVPASGHEGQSASYDPDIEAQIAQWQSAYVSRDDNKPKTGGPIVALSASSENKASTPDPNATKTVVRSGGGQTWQDNSLLEWDPAHFRLFVGNLAGEVTDESLLKAFSKYPSVQKARVIRDKRTTKSRGYGFVSFSDGDEYFQAARDMQGKYIGSHPVLLRKSTTEIRPTSHGQKGGKGGKHGKGGHGKGGNGKVEHGGIGKKQAKTKGGLKILG